MTSKGGGSGRRRILVERAKPVVVGPLQVVDGDDRGSAQRDSRKELAERRKRQLPQLARVAVLGEGRVFARDRLQPAHDRKYLSQRRAAGRQKPRSLVGGQLRQASAQRIDDGIDRLVGDRLALVAPPLEQGHVAAFASKLPHEVPDERRLADSGFAGHDYGGELALRGCLERGSQPIELRLSPHELRAGGTPRPDARHRLRVEQETLYLDGGRPPRGFESQHGQAQVSEVLGDGPCHGLGGCRGQHAVAHEDELKITALEGQPPRQKVIEQHAHRIDVGGRVRLEIESRLFGGHERGRSENARRHGLAEAVDQQPEIEQHDSSLGRGHHVGWLDVAVHHSRAVQHDQCVEQLSQRLAKASLVEARPDGACRGIGVARSRDPAHRLDPTFRALVGNRRSGTSHERRQIRSVDELHREEPCRAFVVEEKLVESHEIGVADALHGAKLPFESLDPLGLRIAQDFQGDASLVAKVDRLIDVAEAAVTESSNEGEVLRHDAPAR